MLTGKVHDLSGLKKKVRGAKTVFKKLPVWDSPILIIERSAINIVIPDKSSLSHAPC
jgi:hypothetical protein